jgi:hypothetical protein
MLRAGYGVWKESFLSLPGIYSSARFARENGRYGSTSHFFYSAFKPTPMSLRAEALQIPLHAGLNKAIPAITTMQNPRTCISLLFIGISFLPIFD